MLFVISPSIALFPNGGDGLQAYLDSLDKVRALRCEKLFVAHGEPRDDFDERIGWLRDHHLERLDETCGIVRDRPGLTGEEVIRAIKWNVPYPTWEEISQQRWCIVTEGVVILNHLVVAAAPSAARRTKRGSTGISEGGVSEREMPFGSARAVACLRGFCGLAATVRKTGKIEPKCEPFRTLRGLVRQPDSKTAGCEISSFLYSHMRIATSRTRQFSAIRARLRQLGSASGTALGA